MLLRVEEVWACLARLAGSPFISPLPVLTGGPPARLGHPEGITQLLPWVELTLRMGGVPGNPTAEPWVTVSQIE